MKIVKVMLFTQPNGFDGFLSDLDAEDKNAFLYEMYKLYPTMFRDETDIMNSDFMMGFNNKEFFFMLNHDGRYFAYDKYSSDNIYFRINPKFHEMVEYYKSFFSLSHLKVIYHEIEKETLLNNYIIGFNDICEEYLDKKN